MKNSLIFIITFYLLAFGFSANAQVYNMTAGTINSCSGNFYDPGGSGANYGNNVNITETFCSNSSNCIIVTFTAFNTQAGNDILTIYDGPSTASPVIGTFSGNKPGWAATISCGSCGSSYLMNNTSVATCSGLFFDSGGSASNYGNNENFTKTFCSSAGSCLQIQFTAFNIKSGDNLIVYDGPTVASPQIGTYSGTTIPPTMLSSTGCLTVRFTSNGASNGAGWEAVVSCEQCPSTPAGTATYTQPWITKYLCGNKYGFHLRWYFY